jgi:hypothetical protein
MVSGERGAGVVEAYDTIAQVLKEPIKIRCACGGVYEIVDALPAAEELQSQVAPDRKWKCTGCYHNIYTGRYWGTRE